MRLMVTTILVVLGGCTTAESRFEKRRAQLTEEEKVAVDACVDSGLEPGDINMEFVDCAIREFCLRKGLPANSAEYRACFSERKDLYLVRYFSRELDIRWR